VPTTDVQTFRILVVDDSPRVPQIVEENLGEHGGPVRIDYAANAVEASTKLEDNLYDLALLDIYDEQKLNIGYEVFRRIDAGGFATRVILMTRFHLKPEDAPKLLQLTGSPSAWRLAGFIDKNASFGAEIRGKVGDEVKAFCDRQAVIVGIEPLAREIAGQRYRYKNKLAEGQHLLRKSRPEICTEIDRLLRSLYVDLPGMRRPRVSRVHVDLTAMERRGLSAAVVANATVSVSFETLSTEGTGHKTVLKIGPKDDILEEAGRFFEYVRYGVELADRVELLAVAGADALGGLVYSFAGGTYKNELLSLDEMLVEDLRSGDLQISKAAFEPFIGREKKIWYAVTCPSLDLGEYFQKNYSTDLKRSCHDGEGLLRKLTERWGAWPRLDRGQDAQQDVGQVLRTPGGTALELPDVSVLGWDQLAHNVEACLIHGDMHGGNVMIECSRRVGTEARRFYRACLIDFRSSGPGPRCLDAVTLESSIRLADAVLLNERFGAQNPPAEAAQADFAEYLARCLEAEIALYRFVFLGVGERPTERWAQLAAALLEQLIDCFNGAVDLREYLASSIRGSIRTLGFPLNDFARLRLSAWLAAQYVLARELPS